MKTGLIKLSLITAMTLSACASREGTPLQEAAMQEAQQTSEEYGACSPGTAYNVQYMPGMWKNSVTEFSPFDGNLRILMMNYDISIIQHDASLHEVLHYCHYLYHSEEYSTPIPTYKGKVVKTLGFLQIYEDGTYDNILEEAYASYMTKRVRNTWGSALEEDDTENSIKKFMETIVSGANNIDPSQMTLSQFIHAVFLKSVHDNPHLLSELTDITHQIKAGTMTIDDAMYRIYLLRE